MALTAQEETGIRNAIEKIAYEKGVPVTWVKSEINGAVGAIEDRWDAASTQTALSNDIEAAAPGVFSNAEKKYIAAVWLIMRGKREREAL